VNILITGSKGFVRRNLVARLKRIKGMPAERPVKKSVFSLFLRPVVLLDAKPAW
jgi:hypothetical protein